MQVGWSVKIEILRSSHILFMEPGRMHFLPNWSTYQLQTFFWGLPIFDLHTTHTTNWSLYILSPSLSLRKYRCDCICIFQNLLKSPHHSSWASTAQLSHAKKIQCLWFEGWPHPVPCEKNRWIWHFWGSNDRFPCREILKYPPSSQALFECFQKLFEYILYICMYS